MLFLSTGKGYILVLIINNHGPAGRQGRKVPALAHLLRHSFAKKEGCGEKILFYRGDHVILFFLKNITLFREI
ncbi:MAG TPA: hypothetical protein DDY20_08570 [Desulfobulbaceae bacterium]|nr:hypothetical protein [Desulfobulbaceae bacterium]